MRSYNVISDRLTAIRFARIADLSPPTVGDEIGKTRPCVIVSNDEIGVLRLKVVVPITGWNDIFAQIPWMVRIEPTLLW